MNIHFFVQIPYHVDTNINEVLDLFVEQIPKKRRNQIHISLLPNASIFLKRDFLLTYKNNPFALVEKLAEKTFLVKQVYNAKKKVLGKILSINRQLIFKKQIPSCYKFTLVNNEDHYLYNDKFQQLATVSAIESNENVLEAKCRWLVKQADRPIKIGKTTLVKDKILEWDNGPRVFQLIPCSKYDEFIEIRKSNLKKYEEHCRNIEKYSEEFQRLSHLKFYEWFREDSNGNTKDIPYGQFRRKLLNFSRLLLSQIYRKQQHAYILTFDPDCTNLFVKNQFNLFDMYIHQIITNNYPYLLTSGYRFSDSNPILNRIYRLNYEMQMIMHKYLPGSAYFTECNSLIRYEPEIFKDKTFKFSSNNNEILPLIKYFVKNQCNIILINDYPLETSVPKRILEQVNSNVLTKQHYISLKNLSQTLIHPQSFQHALNSALTISIKNTPQLRKNLADLWNLHSPLSIENLDKKLSSSKYLSQIEQICMDYDENHSITNEKYFQTLNTMRNDLKNSIASKSRQTKVNTDEITENCIKICQQCGLLCAQRILQWIHNDK